MTVRINLANLLVLCFIAPAFGALTLDTSLKPDKIYDGTTKTLRIRCQFIGSTSDKTVQNLKLDFKKMSSNTKQLAQVIGMTATITDPTLTSRATVTGEIFPSATSSYLDLSIGNVSCAEVGFYTCKTDFTSPPDGTPGSQQKQAEVEGKSYPMELQVKHEPVKPKYSIGEEVTIICSGKVGKPENVWRWQEYDEADKLFKPVTNGVTNNPSSIVSDCAFYAETKLRYLVEDDREHKFRCVAGQNVDASVTTSINGEVGGASVLLISPVLLFCTVFFAIWQ